MTELLERPRPTHLLPDLFAAMVDEVDYPMLLVSRGMQLIHANRAARQSLEDARCFRLSESVLQLRSAPDQTAVGHAVEVACTRGLRSFVRLQLAQGGCDAVAVVPQRGRDDDGADTALLLLGRTRVCEELSMHAYARNHSLTASETRVLGALCAGQSASAIASSHGVAMSTVRSQMNSLRAKTGARNIDDLLLKVAALPPLVNALRLGAAVA